MKQSGWLLAIVLIFATIGCDRVTKHWASTNLAHAESQSFLGDTFRLEYAENTGAFLSLGSTLPDLLRTGLLTYGVAIGLIIVAVVAVKRHWTGMPLAGAALIWAGGVSNLVDRAVRGSVVDFMNLGLGSLRTGIFNVADIAILAGAVLIAFSDLHKKPDVQSQSPQDY
jgi:signal peptidase II